MLNLLPEPLLWAVAVTGSVVALVPILAGLFGLGGVRFTADPDPDAAQPPADDAEARDAFDELCALGFEPAGVVTERMWLMVGEWHKSFSVRCLSTPDGRTFGSLYRLVPGEGVRVALTTCTSGGSLVQTTMPGAGAQVMNDRGVRVELSRRPLAELLASHGEHVELYCRERGETATPETLTGMTAANQAFQVQSAGAAGHAATLMMLIFFVLPGIFVASILSVLGFRAGDSRALALSLCGGSAAYLFARFWVIPEGMRQECLRINPPRTSNPFSRAAP